MARRGTTYLDLYELKWEKPKRLTMLPHIENEISKFMGLLLFQCCV